MTKLIRNTLLPAMTLILLGFLALTNLNSATPTEETPAIACIEPPLERYGTAAENANHHFNLSPDCVVQVPGEPGAEEESRHLSFGLCFPELKRCDEAENHYYRLHLANHYSPETFSRTIELFDSNYDEYISTNYYSVYISPPQIRERTERTTYIYTYKNNENIFVTCNDTALNCVSHGLYRDLGIRYTLHSNNMAFRDWLQLHDSVEEFIRASIEQVDNAEK